MPTNDPFANVPLAVTSRLRTASVNEAVTLYEGIAIITETDGPKERSVVVVHEWMPRPVIVCRYSTPGEQPFHGNARLLHEPVTLEIPSLGVKTEVYHYDGYSCGDVHRHGLAFRRSVVINENATMSRAVFHLINSRDFSESSIKHESRSFGAGRIEFATDEWAITIDRTENSNELIKSLEQAGGRAFTHRVQISRVDQSEFDSKALEQIAALTEHFIAFVTGSWACLALPIGYSGEAESWQFWSVRQANSWANPYTWSSHLPAKCVRAVFRGFARRFMDDDWSEPLCQAVDWYTQCRNGTVETSIILCQAALELLAWVIYIENGEIILGTAGFENLWASDRIRLLLSQMRVSYEFPTRLTQLRDFKFDTKKTYADGPHAITEIRNGITHPKKEKRERFGTMGPALRQQASELGLFYLECSLLGLCGYFGPFRADIVYGSLYTREATLEPLYQTADFNQILQEDGSRTSPDAVSEQ